MLLPLLQETKIALARVTKRLLLLWPLLQVVTQKK